MKKLSAGAFFWAYAAQGLNVAGGLVLMPMALYFLSAEELAIWYVFLAAVTLGNILDFGLSPTVARFTSYAMAGCETFQASGISRESTSSSAPNYRLLKALYSDVSKLYWLLGLLALLIVGGGGWLYFRYIGESNNLGFMPDVMMAWAGYAISISLYLGFLYFVPILQGLGQVRLAYKAIALSRGLIVALGGIALLLGYGLVGLALSQLLGVIFGILLSWVGLRRSKSWLVMRHFTSVMGTPSSFRAILPTSWRTGLIGLSAFMINRSTVFFAAAFLPLAVSAQYSLMMQVLWVFMAIAQVYFGTQVPLLARARITEDHKYLKARYVRLQLVCLFVYVILVFSFLGVGVPLLGQLNEAAADISRLSFFVASLMIGLELHHSMAAGFLMTKNEVPMVPSALLSALGTVGGTVAGLILYPEIGVWILIGVQMTIQAIYNNWKWPLEVYKELNPR